MSVQVKELRNVLAAVASGDLSIDVEEKSRTEIGGIQRAVRTLSERLSNIVDEIQASRGKKRYGR